MIRLLKRQEWYEIRKNTPEGSCNLCDGQQIVLGESTHWVWVAALAPYWKHHTMLIPRRHITEVSQLTSHEWQDFCEQERKVVNIYKSFVKVDASGQDLNNVLIFWRHRNDMINPILNMNELDHLHIHFTYDRNHFLDPISDQDAASWDTHEFQNKFVN